MIFCIKYQTEKNNMRKFSLPALALMLSITFNTAAQTPADITAARASEAKAMKAYQAKDFDGFLKGMEEANSLRPNHPRLLYNLADAYALSNKPTEALSTLAQLGAMGMAFQPDKDEDFKSMFELEGFKTAVAKFAENSKPLGSVAKAFSIPDKTLLTESVAYDPQTLKFFVASVHQRKIVVRQRDGNVSDFSKPEDGLYSVAGLKVDVKRRLLWACSTAFPQMRGFQKDDAEKSGVFAYDLKTGKLWKKFLLPADGAKHAFGDLEISKSGEVFIADSLSPVIYRVNQNTGALEEFLRSDRFQNLQGITFSYDEKYLFVADYSFGVFRVDMKDKSVLLLLAAENACALGIDGMYFYRGSLIGIQNGINPHRVTRFKLDSGFTKITAQKILAANLPDFNEPTLGVLDGNTLYFIANSQWGLVSDKGELNKDKMSKPVILRIALAKN
jgi:sugar lactone lactonase YvrE